MTKLGNKYLFHTHHCNEQNSVIKSYIIEWLKTSLILLFDLNSNNKVTSTKGVGQIPSQPSFPPTPHASLTVLPSSAVPEHSHKLRD